MGVCSRAPYGSQEQSSDKCEQMSSSTKYWTNEEGQSMPNLARTVNLELAAAVNGI